jgi:hypothetical protein
MRNQNTFGDKVSNWKVIIANIVPRLEEMPHLQPVLNELQALVAEAEELDAEQEMARGRFREMSIQRREILGKGQAVRSRVAAHLKGTFGYTSGQLVQFGLNPLKTVGRKRPVRRKKVVTFLEPSASPIAQ